MAATDLQAQLEGRLDQAGLLPYLDTAESRFLDLEDDFLVELVARDSTKLSEFGRVADAVKLENPRVKTLVRARWEIGDIGKPIQAYDIPGPGAPRMAVMYPVHLKSGQGLVQVWVEVTTLASMAFDYYKVNEEAIVREFLIEQLSKGGASYWDPQRVSRLEINGDMAEYIASMKSRATRQ
jgi:hypothetical protein